MTQLVSRETKPQQGNLFFAEWNEKEATFIRTYEEPLRRAGIEILGVCAYDTFPYDIEHGNLSVHVEPYQKDASPLLPQEIIERGKALRAKHIISDALLLLTCNDTTTGVVSYELIGLVQSKLNPIRCVMLSIGEWKPVIVPS